MSEFGFGALVGLDWRDTSHEVALWEEQRQTCTNERIEPTPAALRAWIDALHARFDGAPIAVAIEQSRGAVFDTLSSYSFVTLYPINPRSAARYREAFIQAFRKTIRPTPPLCSTCCASTATSCAGSFPTTRLHVCCGF